MLTLFQNTSLLHFHLFYSLLPFHIPSLPFSHFLSSHLSFFFSLLFLPISFYLLFFSPISLPLPNFSSSPQFLFPIHIFSSFLSLVPHTSFLHSFHQSFILSLILLSPYHSFILLILYALLILLFSPFPSSPSLPSPSPSPPPPSVILLILPSPLFSYPPFSFPNGERKCPHPHVLNSPLSPPSICFLSPLSSPSNFLTHSLYHLFSFAPPHPTPSLISPPHFFYPLLSCISPPQEPTVIILESLWYWLTLRKYSYD